MAKLTDKQKKRIIAEYIDGVSINKLAEKYKTSWHTAKKIVEGDPEIIEKCELKKEENKQDIIEYMESKKHLMISMFDKYMQALLDDDRIESSNMSQLTTALGTMLDKFLLTSRENTSNQGALNKLYRILEEDKDDD